MKISLLEKIMINNMLPTEGNIRAIVILKDLKKKVELTQDDIRDFDIQVNDKGGLKWNEKGVEASFEIEFTELETMEIVQALKKLDRENKLSIDMVSLVELFKVTSE